MKFDLQTLVKKRVVVPGVSGSMGVEASYRNALLRVNYQVATFIRQTLPELPNFTADASSAVVESWLARLGAFIDAAVAPVHEMVRRLFQFEGQSHTRKWTRAVKKVMKIDLKNIVGEHDINELLIAAALRNSSLITGYSEDLKKNIANAVLTTMLESGGQKALRVLLQTTFEVASNRAKTIARDQVAKLNADLSRFRQEQAGIDSYMWSTALDERVRPSHRVKEGEIFKWSQPPEDTGHPGHDINCRCVAMAVVE